MSITADEIPQNISKEYARSVSTWAAEMSDVWTGTTVGKMIDLERSKLDEALKSEDWDTVNKVVASLAESCDYAERTAREHG